ncbi:precorrin-2 C(20)-methyltransferase [Shimia haliotis]|uniref:Precorrin-2 C20-methyltransferase n=1 Tax=Shimia haliotis TaxID=1280847 RepID=A0A1I4GV81_9RHOB|nr:precorrin-2 C(20)-methyltransferase [Shimia haliotis]SFL33938.1 precorrin-2 C20-methyltransferase [Shimia haliotis]
MTQTGTIHGVGLGPGDPDLMSVRAHRLLSRAKHVAFFRKAGRKGQARQIVEDLLPDNVIEFPMEYPVTTEIPLSDPRYNQALSTFYEEVTQHLIALAQSGDDVVVLCEGDPFFYGSFMHLYARLRDVVPVQVVPAITGMSGAWTATEAPITWGDDVLTVLMATLDEAKLTHHISETDALVVMKIGSNFEKVVRALKTAGRFDDAWIVQYATMPNQNVIKLSEMVEDVTPYFSIIVVHGQGRRP